MLSPLAMRVTRGKGIDEMGALLYDAADGNQGDWDIWLEWMMCMSA
jgi:hypothetical protein